MIIDLSHNKIIDSAATAEFRQGVEENLIPLLKESYGDSLRGIQMYEDYISDGFSYNKEWYYPLTVMTETDCEVKWIKWEMKKGKFNGNVPYSYVGKEPLEFSIAYEVPEDFVKASSLRSHYFADKTVKVRVETTATDITFLSGKYSQTFIDEMARQLTAVISDAMGVKNIEDSSLEIAVVFAPETYMEHTSENVTYRRLLLVDKSSAPKDLWIKWTRVDGKGAYTVSDHVDSASIVFELGEDVPQKIKEKEYRFLSAAGKEKYHTAMGRKNVIAWREVIKRAVRKGELEKVEVIEEPAIAVAVAANESVKETVAEPKAVAPVSEEDELQLAMEMARKAMDSIADDTDQLIDDEEEDEDEGETDELEAFYAETEETERNRGAMTDDDEERRELDEITRMAMEALRIAKAEADEDASLVRFDGEDEEEEDSEDIAEESEAEDIVFAPDTVDPCAEEDEPCELDEIEDEEALEDEEILADVRALEPDDEPEEEPTEEPSKPEPLATVAQPEPKAVPTPERTVNTAELEAKIRSEIEAKIRLEYETQARQRAEEEAEKLRREQEQLRKENERLLDRARREKAEWERLEKERLDEAERLRAQIENQARQEAKERERIAEQARLAVEEQHKLEAQRLHAERLKLEEERRIAEEARQREEARRIEAERKEAERRQKLAEEAKAKEAKEEPRYVDNNYTYVSKTVRLIFRRSVDPNITVRLHEIIKATLEYYGKEKVYMRIKATVPDSSTVCLEFVKIPLEEMELLGNIIKVIGNSGLGIAKAILE